MDHQTITLHTWLFILISATRDWSAAFSKKELLSIRGGHMPCWEATLLPLEMRVRIW